ncbi:hypothetical protein FAUST_4264 [Fusarium austroamericanum]|uniref:F-box domain-containing protein n=1 Tax=Fusarium austroamericanum TaxID=282268 RepID=A0AAN6C374_FUSAU|nr:hypothetical protein FAUST_4264 [Fusarium austroamericanum]
MTSPQAIANMTNSQITAACPLIELPMDLIVKILHLLPFRDVARVAQTCKGLYQGLIGLVYEHFRVRFWIPLGFGCATGNVSTIRRCLNQLGAPVDCHLPTDNGTHRWGDQTYYVVGGCRPLREAMQRLHVPAVKLLLENGADPNVTVEEASRQITTSPLAYAYRRGRESRRNVQKAKAICMLLLLEGADPRVLDPVKQLEMHIMLRVEHYIPASWR